MRCCNFWPIEPFTSESIPPILTYLPVIIRDYRSCSRCQDTGKLSRPSSTGGHFTPFLVSLRREVRSIPNLSPTFQRSFMNSPKAFKRFLPIQEIHARRSIPLPAALRGGRLENSHGTCGYSNVPSDLNRAWCMMHVKFPKGRGAENGLISVLH
jgi:hypothetical protein